MELERETVTIIIMKATGRRKESKKRYLEDWNGKINKARKVNKIENRRFIKVNNGFCNTMASRKITEKRAFQGNMNNTQGEIKNKKHTSWLFYKVERRQSGKAKIRRKNDINYYITNNWQK